MAAVGPRYSIIPAGAVTDKRLQGRDLQVLCLIGRHTDRAGWCRLNQGKAAEALDVSRTTVSRSISRLIGYGYLDQRKRYRPDGGTAAASYRVRMDLADDEAGDLVEVEADETGAESAAGAGADTQDVVGTPVANMHTPLCTLGAHPPVHSGCTPLTTPGTNDLKKAQRQKKAEPLEADGAQALPQAGDREPGERRVVEDDRTASIADADPAQDDASAGDGGKGGDGAPDGETGATDRSAAARKAAETRLLNDLIRDWPRSEFERQPRVLEAWAALSAAEKRDAARRAPVYLQRATAAGRKRERLVVYLGERRFAHLPDPAERPVSQERNRLPEDVAWQFLAGDGARGVLGAALEDGLLVYLLDEVRRCHAVPAPEQYAGLAAEWGEVRAAYERRLAGDDQIAMALRKSEPKRLARLEAAAVRAREILGHRARAGPAG